MVMFQSLLDFFREAAPWHTAAFGIFTMLFTGACWCIVGLVMGDAPKHGVRPPVLLLCEGASALCIGLLVATCLSDWSTASPQVSLLCILAFFVVGFLEFLHLHTMSKAMQEGPNGIIWAILQSAMICPFLLGVLYFGEEARWVRWTGLALMLLALVCFAFAKDNQRGTGNAWKYRAFLYFAICSVQQCIGMLPFYYEEAKGFPNILRSTSTGAGLFAAPLLFFLCRHRSGAWRTIWEEVHKPHLWKYVAAMLSVDLLLTYALLYPGMNTMTDVGLGNACYPLLVGSCIVSFSLTSIFLLRERPRLIQYFALLCCLLGILLLSLH